MCEGVEVIFWEERERVLIERESVCERVRERDIYTVRERERERESDHTRVRD